jgi:hypothetical protein
VFGLQIVEPARAVQHEVAQDRQRPAIANDAAISGAFQLAPGVPRLPRLPLAIALPLMIGLPPLLLSRAVATVLDAIPAPWLVAQVYRVFGGIFWSTGRTVRSRVISPGPPGSAT